MEKYSAHLVDAGLTFIDNAVLVHGFDNGLVKKLPTLNTFAELGRIAVEMLDKRGKPFAFISGPMRSGPLGYIGNAREMDRLCSLMAKSEEGNEYSMSVFYQLVFQVEIHRIRERDYKRQDDLFIRNLCENFTKPVIHHQLLQRFVRMPNADISTGARHELKIFKGRHDSNLLPVQEIQWSDFMSGLRMSAL